MSEDGSYCLLALCHADRHLRSWGWLVCHFSYEGGCGVGRDRVGMGWGGVGWGWDGRVLGG